MNIGTLYGYFKVRYSELKDWSTERDINKGCSLNSIFLFKLLRFNIKGTPIGKYINVIFDYLGL